MAEAPDIPKEEPVEATPQSDSWWGSSWLQAAKNKSAEVFDTVRKDVNELAQTAKDKSAEVYDYVRKDFDEFTQTVSEEVSTTATALKEKLKIDDSSGTAATVKRSVTSFLNQVSDVFYIPPEDDDEPIFLDRLTAIIYTLGSDPATFLVDPDATEFEAWQESLNLESQQADIAALMANNEKLRHNFETLVPSKVSEAMFWARYLFRIHVVREEETKRQIIRKEAQVRAQADIKGNDLNWDDDEILTSPEEIPEEVQSKLLAEYEKECQGRLASEDKGELKCKEKGDMVLVSRSGESGSTSPGKESSNEDDWEEAIPPVVEPKKEATKAAPKSPQKSLQKSPQKSAKK
ncbi:BSD domain-containing protein 1-B-like isoform X2 [Daphnia carinata]|uniref:BSD domain-containing protein 1-B-like isoform X2 n=1 Tax=Daphnia carinata TaxID=120202 RepID=UPI00286894CE|nr:BSD domain-containing protein 1-B-like isoform X2 [Daphnia carinata]